MTAVGEVCEEPGADFNINVLRINEVTTYLGCTLIETSSVVSQGYRVVGAGGWKK